MCTSPSSYSRVCSPHPASLETSLLLPMMALDGPGLFEGATDVLSPQIKGLSPSEPKPVAPGSFWGWWFYEVVQSVGFGVRPAWFGF